MNLDRMIYLVISNHEEGPFFPETNLADTSLVILTKDILAGQYSNIMAVLELNPTERTCREATDDFREIIERDPDDASA
jgi:hypothetical protein